MGIFNFGNKDKEDSEAERLRSALKEKNEELRAAKQEQEEVSEKLSQLQRLIDGDEEMENLQRLNLELTKLRNLYKELKQENEQLKMLRYA